jgi:hypothetical protein
VRLSVTQYTKLNERNSGKERYNRAQAAVCHVRLERKQGKERMSAMARSTRRWEIAKTYLGLELTVDERSSKRS